MDNLQIESKKNYYIYLWVDRLTSIFLKEFSEKVSKILWGLWIDFYPRQDNFHVTVEFFGGKLSDLLESYELYKWKFNKIKETLETQNGIDSTLDYDESFNQLYLMKSNTNWRIYLCLTQHNNDSRIYKLMWEDKIAHISLWYFRDPDISIGIEDLPKNVFDSRDLIFASNWSIWIDWSELKRVS